MSNVFWANDILAGTTNSDDLIIGTVKRIPRFGGFHVSFGTAFASKLTDQEDMTALEGFDTRAEARRFVEKIAVRHGHTIISQRDGMSQLIANQKGTNH